MTIAEYVRLFHLRASNIMWFIGAGASAAAGVPTAYHLIWRFKQMIYCSEQHVPLASCNDLGDPVLQGRLQSYFDSKRQFPALNSDDEYAHYFETALPNEGDRRRFLDSMISQAKPSYGHLALAALMRLGKARILWTTNFDPLVEDATSTMLGSTGRLTVATLDSPTLADTAILEERYPALIKLHGDFRSRRLKNTGDELRTQDEELRKHLINSCGRFGLAVVGYSGRDNSIMEALEAAIAQSKTPFPFGLFWFCRSDTAVSPRVSGLIETVRKSGIEAYIVEVETFDELMADLLVLLDNVPDEVKDHLSRRRARISDPPLPSDKGTWPVLRLNALQVSNYPILCRRAVCQIGGTKEVRDAALSVGADVIAVRRQTGVIGFGRDTEMKRAFSLYNISEFDFYTIEPRRLRYESMDNSLLKDALCRGLQRERPLLHCHRHRDHVLAVDPTRKDDPLFGSLREAAGQLTGTIPRTNIGWSEAIVIRIEYRMEKLWLIVEPTIWLHIKYDHNLMLGAAKFIRDRLASRYNKVFSRIISGWANVITRGEPQSTVRAFGIDDGCDASFTLLKETTSSQCRRVK